MANSRGAHQRPQGSQSGYTQHGQQGSAQREAYEQAYQQYIQEQAADSRAARQRGAQGDVGYGVSAGQRYDAQQHAYRRVPPQRSDGYRQQAGGYAPVRQVGQAGAYGPQSWNAVPKKKGHPVRNAVIVILVILIVVGGFGGFTGYTLYNSAKTVKADASKVMADISDLKDQILGEQQQQAVATASDIAKRSENMKEETSGWAWTVASFVPVYGSDIAMVRDLSTVLDDLADNAIVPLVDEVSQVSVKNLMSDGAINVELAQRLVNAIDSAEPVISRSAAKVEKMGDAHLDQVREPLEKAKSTLGKLDAVTKFVSGIAPSFASMMGADGQPRTYLIVAQNNAEIRSTGGFLGSVGPLYLNNGQISMGDFRTIYDIYPDEGNGAPLTEEELAVFGPHVGWQIADSNFIPDFTRVSDIVKYAWETKGYGGVDAVIGVDPVFLQHMLALAGPVTTSGGITVDGSNAAVLLLHDAYYWDAELQDPFFEEVAALSFQQLMGNLGDVSMTDLANAVTDDINARRLQMRMFGESEQAAIDYLGCSGALSHDETAPELGVFLTDESYSKLFWYVKLETAVGDPVANADGTMTYPVSMTYRNMIDPGAVSGLPDYTAAHNPIARNGGDMIAWVMLSAPQGGRITDLACTEGEFMPEGTHYRDGGSYVSGTMAQATLQGLDFWYGLTRTLPGGAFSLSFNVTVPSTATEPLKVVHTPTTQEVAGW